MRKIRDSFEAHYRPEDAGVARASKLAERRRATAQREWLELADRIHLLELAEREPDLLPSKRFAIVEELKLARKIASSFWENVDVPTRSEELQIAGAVQGAKFGF